VLQGYGRFDLANRPVLAFAVQQVAGFWWILARGWGLEALMWNVLAGWTLAGAIGLAHFGAGAPGFRWSAPHEALRQVRTAFAFGGPMQLSNLLAAIHAQAGKLLLSRLDRLASVSPYELGARISTSAGTLPQLMLVALLPEASAFHAAGDTDRLRTLYSRASRWVLFATALVFAPLIGAADRLYAVWIGTPQPEAALAFRVLGISAAIVLSTGVGTTIARGAGRTDLETWSVFAGVVLHVSAGVLLIPRFGLAGALIAFAVGSAVAVLLFLVRLGRALGWSLRDTLAPLPMPVLATAAGAVMAYALDLGLPVASGVAGWGWLAAAGSVGLATALGVLAFGGYVSIQEARALLSRR
jgi:O-antigen/teichoic acid export membrane protein